MNALIWLIEKDLNPTLIQRLHEALTRRGFLTGLGATTATAMSAHKAMAPENKKGDYGGYAKKWNNLPMSDNIEDRRNKPIKNDEYDPKHTIKWLSDIPNEISKNQSSKLAHHLGIDDMRSKIKWPKGPGKSTPRSIIIK